MSDIRYHPGGFKPNAPAQNMAERADLTLGYTRWAVDGTVLEQRPLTTAEVDAVNAQNAAIARASNADTLRQQGLAAIQANRAWTANTLPQVQAGVDAIQAKAAATSGGTGAWPSRAQAAPTLANLAAVTTHFGNVYDLILLPLVQQVRDLSLAVETLGQELGRSKGIEDALIRLVLDQFDATD